MASNMSMVPIWVTAMESVCGIKTLLMEKPFTYSWFIPKVLYSFFTALGLISFIDSPITGMFIFLALAWAKPVALAAVIGAFIVSFVLCMALNAPIEDILGGYLFFNSTVVASVATCVLPGYLGIQISFTYWLFLLGATLFTVLVNIGLCNMLKQTRIKPITMPFNIGISALFLVAGTCATNGSNIFSLLPNQKHNHIQNDNEIIQWMKLFEGSLISLGQIFGTNNLTSSILMWIGIVLYSPMAFALLYAGSFLAALTAVAISSPLEEIYEGLWGFNAILASGGLCCFVLQTPFAMVCTLFAAFFATTVQAGIYPIFKQFGLLVFSVPAHVAMYTILLASLHERAPLIFAVGGPPQELQLHRYAHNKEFPSIQKAIVDTTNAPKHPQLPMIIVTESINGYVINPTRIDGCLPEKNEFYNFGINV